MHAGFACDCYVDIAVAVEIFGDELGASAGGACDGNGDAMEGSGGAVDFVLVDHQGIVGAGVVAFVAAIAFAG